LDAFYQSLSPKQLNGIRAVAMDMWEPYISSTLQNVPDAASKIVFDRFHVMKHMLEAVDSVRKAEHRVLQEQGDDSLKGTRYFWFYSDENLPQQYAERFAHLRRLNLKTSRAWAIKETLRDLWNCRDASEARQHWQAWNSWAIRSGLKPVVNVARMIRAHLENVLTFCEHRITNATIEGLNSKIQSVKKTHMVTAIEST
jgi:transposase